MHYITYIIFLVNMFKLKLCQIFTSSLFTIHNTKIEYKTNTKNDRDYNKNRVEIVEH